MKGCKGQATREEGQSIVILAMAMVGLLVFAGLAVDAGVIYVTSVRLARAVDAAALAGVVELPYEISVTSTDRADARAEQFLEANEIEVDITDIESFDSSRQSGVFGVYRYLITATHQAELYFLPLVNFRYVRLRDSAVAEYNPLVNIYASQTGNYGQEQTVNLAAFGPASCTGFGDAYSPDRSQWWDELRGVYHFRLNIPPDYESRAQTLTETYNEGDVNSVVRVEIWDPDCYNAPGDSIQIEHSATGEMLDLPCAKPGRQEPCTPETGDPGNPFAFLRIDENRSGTLGSNSGCSTPSNYEWDYNTTTKYTLYYYRVLRGGTLERVNLAGYTKGGEQNDDDTDLLWVCPGGSLPDDPTDVDFGSFEVDIPDDIYASPDGVRSFFLEIETLDGASENGFDLWAGPRYPHVPSEVNERNLFLLENVGAHDSAGATWFGIGHLPQNSNSPVSHVLITLAYVPPEWEGRTVVVSGFDHEPGLTERLTFTIDTTPDWQVPVSGTVFVDGNWHTHKLALPGAPTHTFYGGYLQVWYDAKSQHDTFGWKITTEAIPKLVE